MKRFLGTHFPNPDDRFLLFNPRNRFSPTNESRWTFRLVPCAECRPLRPRAGGPVTFGQRPVYRQSRSFLRSPSGQLLVERLELSG